MIAIDPPRSRSPWLSVWFAPRETIARILATNPKRHVLLLACLVTGLYLVVSATSLKLFDWRVLVPAAGIGAALGVASLYINGLAYSWAGRLFFGHATPLAFRAMVSWASVPLAAGLMLELVMRLGLARPQAIGVSEQLARILNLVAAGVCGLAGLWSIIILALMAARVQSFGFWRAAGNIILGLVVCPLLIALCVRVLLFQPFNIPSGSMMPTLLVGDYVFASKYSYGYSRYSFPVVLPLFDGRALASKPKRGDVVIFRSPKDGTADYVKRIVGLPNDRIQMINGVLNINGAPVKQEPIEDFVWRDESGEQKNGRRWREILPEGVTYETLDLQDNGILDNTDEYTVPPEHYFVLGDNRDNSLDSRTDQFGYVPFENLIGRAAIIYLSVESATGTQENTVRFERLGTLVK